MCFPPVLLPWCVPPVCPEPPVCSLSSVQFVFKSSVLSLSSRLFGYGLSLWQFSLRCSQVVFFPALFFLGQFEFIFLFPAGPSPCFVLFLIGPATCSLQKPWHIYVYLRVHMCACCCTHCSTVFIRYNYVSAHRVKCHHFYTNWCVKRLQSALLPVVKHSAIKKISI